MSRVRKEAFVTYCLLILGKRLFHTICPLTCLSNLFFNQVINKAEFYAPKFVDRGSEIQLKVGKKYGGLTFVIIGVRLKHYSKQGAPHPYMYVAEQKIIQGQREDKKLGKYHAAVWHITRQYQIMHLLTWQRLDVSIYDTGIKRCFLDWLITWLNNHWSLIFIGWLIDFNWLIDWLID